MQALKFRAGGSVRRDRLPLDQLTFNGLLATFQELFGHPPHNHETLQYLDDQSEWIDISSDRELREAIRLNSDKVLEIKTVRSSKVLEIKTVRSSKVLEIKTVRSSKTPLHFSREGADRRQDSFLNKERRHEWRRSFENHFNRREPVRPHQEDDNAKPSEHTFERLFNGPFRHPADCDNCNTHIVGDRHKCNDCLDYDLCNDCIGLSNGIHPGHTFTTLARSYRRWHHRRPDRTEAKQDARDEHSDVIPQEVPAEASMTGELEKPIESHHIHTPAEERPEGTTQPQEKGNSHPVHSALNASTIIGALQTLGAMGFQDKAKNVGLLMACGGNIEQVAAKLLDEQRL